jgi:hypothetical protein
MRWQEKKLKEYLCCSSVFTLDSSLSSSLMVFHVCLCCSCFNFHVCLSSSLTFMSVSLRLSFYPNLCFFLTKLTLNYFLYKTRKRDKQDNTSPFKKTK